MKECLEIVKKNRQTLGYKLALSKFKARRNVSEDAIKTLLFKVKHLDIYADPSTILLYLLELFHLDLQD